ncbi:VWA domain-containing protein [Methylopila sp. Yamaguchi]|uniref:VWA domain-containing protein n=1 Tax=Methylopila sp. Yamaguchi TaxID=1437817 RepID=UPI000CBDEB3A|nr:VWA domain-containing protein [Methylopila sp. Yamaguchi]GBD49448.1 von Willebrand factor type A [Methylopila sp. Yamaguchi]
MWTFATPLAFLFLPLPFVVLRFARADRRSGGAIRVPGTIVGSGGEAPATASATGGRKIFAWVAWVALVAALAGPQIVLPVQALPTTGRDLFLALDLSGSMERTDFSMDGATRRRLDVVRKIGSDFVRRRAGDRVGLAAFADRAYVAAEPSYDVEAVAEALDALAIGLVGRSTAIGEGLGLALRRLADAPGKSRVVVLLSDGANNAGAATPKDVARLAKELGVRVHTIAMGPRDTTEITGYDPDVVDAETLKAIADASGGQFFRVRTTEDLQAAIASIDEIEPTRTLAPPANAWRELWPWPAGLALLAAAATAIGGRRFS